MTERLAAPRSTGLLHIIGQVLVVAAVAGVIWQLASTTLGNLQARGITTGLGFLNKPAIIEIQSSWLPYQAGQDSYGRAVLIGLINTIWVSLLCGVLGTIAGTSIGLARLSPNWLLSRIAGAYVEIVRDIPCLLHLLLWYQILLQLPGARQAISLFDLVYLSNRGLWFPAIDFRSGVPAIDIPHLSGFNFTGGTLLTPELAALVIGLSIYSSCFVAEIVRAGVQGVPRGQWEASAALGLRPSATVAKVILPQALRIIIPPLGGEYLNVTKNSSLAVVIGYSDLTAIVDTMLSDTGQAIEAVAILMVAYLGISVAISLVLTWYNRRVAIVTR